MPARTAPHRPPPLAPGARVALVAPAGPLRDPSELDEAVANARSLGWEPVCGARVLERRRYLAGSDDDRAADLNAAIRDPRIDAIWCVRGGYGMARILEQLDYDALAARPKSLLGYSDVTALHVAVRARCGLVTFHAPVAREPLTRFTRASLEHALRGTGEPCGQAAAARMLRAGAARGPLVGGNLAVLAGLVGTPFALDTTGAILVLEDVKESVYRIDRLIQQLRMSGALAACAGLVFGHFTMRPEEEDNDDGALDALLAEAVGWVSGPVIAGVPVGHIDDQWTLPLGGVAELDADARTLTTAPATAVA